MADAKASGPMWAATEEGKLYGAVPNRLRDDDIPCRLLPGHDKWVPAELVEAIDIAFDHTPAFQGPEWIAGIRAAIRAAKEGAV